MSAPYNPADFVVQPLAPDRQQLRIALVTETYPPEINGVAMTLGRMVDGLLRRGHAIQLVRPRQNDLDMPAEQRTFEEVLATGVPIPNYGGLKFGLPAKARLTRLWQHKRPDLVHIVTEGPLGWSAIGAARKLRLPVTSDFHTNFHSYSRHYGFSWLKAPIASYLRKFHNRTQATLVPTRALAHELASAGYENLAVVSRGVDTAQFNPGNRSNTLRAAWGANNATADNLVVLYVGRLAPEKNLPLVLDSFAAIRAIRPEARLVFVGDGPLRGSLQASCPTAIFAGMRTGADLATHYASADLFLFPSLTETFGNVTTEALASGLGVVAYQYAAAADLIVDGGNGRHVPPGDAAAFIAAAAELAGDREQLQQVRAAAPASIAQLDWEIIHDSFARTLSGIVASHERQHYGNREFLVVPD
ncbi:MAG: glycosyltransferase family 1 protein [Betaproteobacteria bacterium]|nr:glycosyltransferase family 1 protein [Betaproteobacteria bacterium]